MDFLWRKVSKQEKEDIKKQAKRIIDNFSNNLSKLNIPLEESIIERNLCQREEKESKEERKFSKKIMFENAKEKNNNFIIGERKSW
jgi:Asp-tRNA(Asn)/Glu-tRNA(Gln) amidotransferase C subunit